MLRLLLVFVAVAVPALCESNLNKYPGDSGKCGCCPECCSCLCTEKVDCNKTLEICVVHDSSNSVFPSDWDLSVQFVIDVLTGIYCPGVKNAHITFSTNVSLDWNLNSPTGMSLPLTTSALISLVRFQIEDTNTVAALQAAVDYVFNGGDDPDKMNFILLVTDGRANFNVHQLPMVAAAAQAVSKVIAVGISDRVNETQLEIIATGSGSSNVHTVENFADLPVVVPAVVDSILTMLPPCEPKEEECFCCCPPPEPFKYYSPPQRPCGCHGNYGYNDNYYPY